MNQPCVVTNKYADNITVLKCQQGVVYEFTKQSKVDVKFVHNFNISIFVLVVFRLFTII